MPNYIINTQKTDGRYNEVHVTTCAHGPRYDHQDSLGWHANGVDAVRYAKQMGYPDADGCKYCAPEANHGQMQCVYKGCIVTDEEGLCPSFSLVAKMLQNCYNNTNYVRN